MTESEQSIKDSIRTLRTMWTPAEEYNERVIPRRNIATFWVISTFRVNWTKTVQLAHTKSRFSQHSLELRTKQNKRLGFCETRWQWHRIHGRDNFDFRTGVCSESCIDISTKLYQSSGGATVFNHALTLCAYVWCLLRFTWQHLLLSR